MHVSSNEEMHVRMHDTLNDIAGSNMSDDPLDRV